jgi:hypothetical protein
MKKLLLITCMVAGLAGISLAQTAPVQTTPNTEKTSTSKGKHKMHSGKHKSWSHHKKNKQGKA